MAYLVIDDLVTHLRAEIIDKITRETDSIANTAIDAAISEAKGYLSRYNLDALFDDADTDFVDDPNLLMKVKDLACWHLVKLANPNVNMAVFRTAYEDAIAWLKDIQKGVVDPPGWVYVTDDADTDTDESAAIQYSSNTKRTNHYGG